MEPFALYVHVPYCRHVCPYCDFNVQAAAEPPERAYVAALTAELAAWGAQAPWAGRHLKSVYLGGGTPSLFSPAAIAAIVTAASDVFGLDAGAEVTLEANPGTVTRDSLAGYVAAGVNRLSLGAQSFHPAVLRTLGRDHRPEHTTDAVRAARAVGIANVSLDLIFAVPGETLADWEADVASALALSPTHISAYCLTWEDATPFAAWRASGRLQAVDDDLEAAMGDAGAAAFARAGFVRYEISSWAKPGATSRHNTSYWDGSDYLGLGAGAHSFRATPAPGSRWANLRPPEAYRAAIARAGTAVDQEERLTPAQARSDFVITGLRQMAGVDAALFARRFGAAVGDTFPQLDALVRDGLLEHVEGRIRLTRRGVAFADTVAARFV